MLNLIELEQITVNVKSVDLIDKLLAQSGTAKKINRRVIFRII